MKHRFLTACLVLVGATAPAQAELHPIVEVENGFLLGAVSGKKWIPGETAKRFLKGGEHYRTYSLTESLGTATGGKPEPGGDICQDVFTVALKPHLEAGAVAVGGDWNAMPRIPHPEDRTQEVYVKAVREFLIAQGLRDPKVKITQILRIDLDGDGQDEVLISGTNYFTADGSVPMKATAGSYSFVLVRRTMNGKAQTQMLAGEFYPKAKSDAAPTSYRVAAVLDLSGDGIMEVVVRGAYYEGLSDTVFRCTPKKIETLLQVACGA